ncbi:DUF1259 domain-containing protein [Falsibacillus albus]|uniref:Uncharacterized protein n=1 Tax=Falsibacillus albus TaxID=2478915 RepID=A0A3L7K2U6_9BACI|nr:DUF1259 domain-containing protein [Falsibacillus albus]RLQ96669.1 hypothetical protein D9X91_06075 [Falsibacillus albus]
MDHFIETQSLCHSFASIIGGYTILPISPQFPFCTIGLSQCIEVNMLGRSAADSTMVTDAYFDFGNFDAQGRALIIGRIPVEIRQIPTVTGILARQGILYKVVNGYSFSEPDLPIIYVASIECPISFAHRLLPVLNTLPTIPVHQSNKPTTIYMHETCNQVSNILGGFLIPYPPQQSFCSIALSQYHPITILGRCATQSPTVTDGIFSFVSMDSQGCALNIGRIPVQLKDANEVMLKLTREGLYSNFVEGFPCSQPMLSYIYVQQIEKPVVFAEKIRGVLYGA